MSPDVLLAVILTAVIWGLPTIAGVALCVRAWWTDRMPNPADAQAIQDAEACALVPPPDDPLEQAWALPAYTRPRTTEDTR